MTAQHFHCLEIAQLNRETEDSVSIVFSVPESLTDTFHFTQGQHLVVKANIAGEDVRRSYSICSGVNDGELRVGIKKVQGGVFSSFANSELKVGDIIEVMPPEGRFNTPLDAAQSKRYLGIAAGSGITPLLSIAKSTLEEEPESSFVLVYGNRTVTSMMFSEELLGLKSRFPTRFELINIFSREAQEAELFNGRIDAPKLNGLLDQLVDIHSLDEAFICGPQEMTEAAKDVLITRGMAAKHVHFELFGTATPVAKPVVDDDQDRGPLRAVTVIVDGKETAVDLAEGGENILDAALKAGADLPFACKGGVCCTCRAKVIEGEVKMDVNYALEEDEVQAGFVLTCQAHPLTEKVVVDFDVK